MLDGKIPARHGFDNKITGRLREGEHYNWFCDTVLSCVVGRNLWKGHLPVLRASNIATPSDEALALLLMENSWDCWVERARMRGAELGYELGKEKGVKANKDGTYWLAESHIKREVVLAEASAGGVASKPNIDSDEEEEIDELVLSAKRGTTNSSFPYGDGDKAGRGSSENDVLLSDDDEHSTRKETMQEAKERKRDERLKDGSYTSHDDGDKVVLEKSKSYLPLDNEEIPDHCEHIPDSAFYLVYRDGDSEIQRKGTPESMWVNGSLIEGRVNKKRKPGERVKGQEFRPVYTLKKNGDTVDKGWSVHGLERFNSLKKLVMVNRDKYGLWFDRQYRKHVFGTMEVPANKRTKVDPRNEVLADLDLQFMTTSGIDLTFSDTEEPA